jgi:GTPase SAR1 family protein
MVFNIQKRIIKNIKKKEPDFHFIKHQAEKCVINMRIGFTGTVSVGKTTLVNSLKELPEFKDYKFATERSKYLRDLGIPLNTDSTLKGQTIFLAERCSELINKNIITDRTVIDVMAFTMCADSIDTFDKDTFEEYASRFIDEYDWIFYVSPSGVKIEDNAVRTTDSNYRKQIDEMIKYMCSSNLNKINNFGIISGSTECRIEQIKSYLNL